MPPRFHYLKNRSGYVRILLDQRLNGKVHVTSMTVCNTASSAQNVSLKYTSRDELTR